MKLVLFEKTVFNLYNQEKYILHFRYFKEKHYNID